MVDTSTLVRQDRSYTQRVEHSSLVFHVTITDGRDRISGTVLIEGVGVVVTFTGVVWNIALDLCNTAIYGGRHYGA